MKIQVGFYEEVENDKILFVVICAMYKNKWIWVKHKNRTTLEIPGGHREEGESVLTAAKRELEEETGAISYTIQPICVYGVLDNTRVSERSLETFGGLYFANVEQLGTIDSEIEYISFHEVIPAYLTYPGIQPLLFEYVQMHKDDKKLDNY